MAYIKENYGAVKVKVYEWSLHTTRRLLQNQGQISSNLIEKWQTKRETIKFLQKSFTLHLLQFSDFLNFSYFLLPYQFTGIDWIVAISSSLNMTDGIFGYDWSDRRLLSGRWRHRIVSSERHSCWWCTKGKRFSIIQIDFIFTFHPMAIQYTSMIK